MCSPKTMLKIGLVLAVVLGGGFLVFPQFRPVIIGLAPFALFATCPIAMWFATRGMNKNQGHQNHDGCASCGGQHEAQTKVIKPPEVIK